jgi:hypothetical protein
MSNCLVFWKENQKANTMSKYFYITTKINRLKIPNVDHVKLPPPKKKKEKAKPLTKEEEHKAKFFYLLKSQPEKFLPSLYFLVERLEEIRSVDDNQTKMKKVNLLPRRKKFRLASVPISTTGAKEIFRSLFSYGQVPENIWEALFHTGKLCVWFKMIQTFLDSIPSGWKFGEHINTNGTAVSVMLKKTLSQPIVAEDSDEDEDNKTNSQKDIAAAQQRFK